MKHHSHISVQQHRFGPRRSVQSKRTITTASTVASARR